jgi:hypothetical protein
VFQLRKNGLEIETQVTLMNVLASLATASARPVTVPIGLLRNTPRTWNARGGCDAVRRWRDIDVDQRSNRQIDGALRNIGGDVRRVPPGGEAGRTPQEPGGRMAKESSPTAALDKPVLHFRRQQS